MNEQSNIANYNTNDDLNTNIKILMNNQNIQSIQNSKSQDDINLIKYLIYQEKSKGDVENVNQSCKQD